MEIPVKVRTQKLVAADFFTVDARTRKGLTRFIVPS
jgi:hypothetical protein